MSNFQKRESWGSRFGLVLSSAGCAVGVGNIWRFPYLAGQNGGFGFLLLYFSFLILICYSLMISKMAIGRAAKTNSVDAFEILAQKSGSSNPKIWRIAGFLGILTSFLLACFYFVIAGWTAYYFIQALSPSFFNQSEVYYVNVLSNLETDYSFQIIFSLVFLILTFFSVGIGLKKGVELVNKIMMPVLFILLGIVMIRSLSLEGASKGIDFFLTPKWESLGFINGSFDYVVFSKVALAALGQAFFSLALGMGSLIVFGSYSSDTDNLPKTARQVILLDTAVAIIAGFAILPAVFATGMQPDFGEGLTFVVLPQTFSAIPFGQFFALCFYALLGVAALTSTIGMFEPIVSFLMDYTGWSRSKSSFYLTIAVGTGVLLVILSMTGVITFRFFGQNLFSFLNNFTGNYTFPITALFTAIFAGFVAPKLIGIEIMKSSKWKQRRLSIWRFNIKYIVTTAISIILISSFL